MIRCVAFDFDGTLVDSNIKYANFLDIAAELPGGAKAIARVIDSLSSVTPDISIALSPICEYPKRSELP